MNECQTVLGKRRNVEQFGGIDEFKPHPIGHSPHPVALSRYLISMTSDDAECVLTRLDQA
jgi:hypothetical protein